MLRMLFLGLLLLLPACQKEGAKESPSAKVVASADRGDVVATLQLPAGDSVKALAPMIDKVQPGSAAMAGAQIPVLLAKACGVDLSAADLSRPVSLVVLNPKKFAQPFAVLARIEDRSKLEADVKAAGRTLIVQDGLALIGTAAVVESAKGYAFAALSSPTNQMIAVAYPAPLNAIYKDEIDGAISQMSQAMQSLGSQSEGVMVLMKAYRQAFASIAQQSDRVELSIDSDGTMPSLFFKMYPNAGTTMASLVEAQVPATHDLLHKLPATSKMGIVVSGDMRAGKARDAIVDFGVEAMSAMYKSNVTDQMALHMKPWFDSFDGQVAMTMSLNLNPTEEQGVTTINYLLGANDSQAMRKGWHSMFDVLAKASGEAGSLAMMGMKSKVQVNKDAFTVDGISVDHYHSEFESELPEQTAALERMGADKQDMYLATFDKLAALTTEKNGKESIAAMVAAGRGKAAGLKLPANLSAALKASKLRKESFLTFVDVKALVPGAGAAKVPFQSFIIGFGRDKDALVLRLSMGH